MRLAARVDQNHAEIAEAFRSMGCSVISLASLGKGVHDLLIGRPGWNVLVEIKMAKGKLTPDQETFHAAWKGPQAVIRTIGEAYDLVMVMGSSGRLKSTAEA